MNKFDKRMMIGAIIILSVIMYVIGFHTGHTVGKAQESRRRNSMSVAYHAAIIDKDIGPLKKYAEKWFGPDNE